MSADVRLVLSILVLSLPSSPPDQAAEYPTSPTGSAGGGGRRGGTAVYWGKGNGASEGSLADVCATGKYSHVMLASLTEFGEGRTPKLSLGGHCDPTASASAGGCTRLGAEVRTCQARNVAQYLWDSFLGGGINNSSSSSSSRPLGDAMLDGIDFVVVEGRNPGRYGLLARAIKELGRQGGGSREVYLSAAPECTFPDAYLGPAIDTSAFDFVWVQFFDNPSCQYEQGNTDKLWEAWNQWTNNISSGAGQVFLGLLAGDDAAIGGHIPPAVLVSHVLPVAKASPKYGGVLLWSKHFDDIGRYDDAISGIV